MTGKTSEKTRTDAAMRPDGMPVGRPFEKGNPGGPGRPKGYDFRAIVEDYVKANKTSVESAIEKLFKSLLASAEGGDVNAAKLLIERLCGKDADKLDVAGVIQVVTGVPEDQGESK